MHQHGHRPQRLGRDAEEAHQRLHRAAAIERLLHSLQELALVHRAEPPHGATAPAGARQRYYLPVGSLKDVIGIYPAGLGRSYTELVRLQPAFAQRVVQLVAELHRSGAAIHPPPRRWRRPCRCSTGRPHRNPQQILATAPERTTALLARFGNWAMGAVPQAQRRASVLNEGADVGPVDWLLARGLLVPLDAAHVELPHSVGVSLRGGFVIENFALAAPGPELGHTRRRCAATPRWAPSPKPCGWSANCSTPCASSRWSRCGAAAWASAK